MKEFEKAMKMAINAAEKFVGATSPNPPVGAIALDAKGKILLGAAHQKAGLPHAEAKVLELAKKLGKINEIHTLVVTLEPCNHIGRTPPCTDAILAHKNIKRIVYGALDPNPDVAGAGAERLKKSGIDVIGGVLEQDCKFLIRAFTKVKTIGLPYVTIKTAKNHEGNMIPPAGEKTFTSKTSLIFAHELRKRADAIWTGSGTVLADNPEFTVRWVPDHQDKKRFLILSDRRKRIGHAWLGRAKENGFTTHWAENLEEGLQYLTKVGALEVLVEAGPTLLSTWLKSGLWDEHVIISQGTSDQDDSIEIKFREEEICSQESSSKREKH